MRVSTCRPFFRDAGRGSGRRRGTGRGGLDTTASRAVEGDPVVGQERGDERLDLVVAAGRFGQHARGGRLGGEGHAASQAGIEVAEFDRAARGSAGRASGIAIRGPVPGRGPQRSPSAGRCAPPKNVWSAWNIAPPTAAKKRGVGMAPPRRRRRGGPPLRGRFEGRLVAAGTGPEQPPHQVVQDAREDPAETVELAGQARGRRRRRQPRRGLPDERVQRVSRLGGRVPGPERPEHADRQVLGHRLHGVRRVELGTRYTRVSRSASAVRIAMLSANAS